jgi:hypothetical protein
MDNEVIRLRAIVRLRIKVTLTKVKIGLRLISQNSFYILLSMDADAGIEVLK